MYIYIYRYIIYIYIYIYFASFSVKLQIATGLEMEKPFFMDGIWKNIQLNIRSAS